MSDLRNYIDAQLSGEAPTDADPDATEGDVSDEEAERFVGSLTDAQRERAEADPEYRQELYDQWSTADTADGDADDESDDGDEDDADFVPQSGAEVIAWAAENEAGLREAGWSSAEEFLVVASSDARWWLETADEMGWPAEARPGQRDLPANLGMAAIAAGIPGARLIEDPLHRMRPGSKRRLW